MTDAIFLQDDSAYVVVFVVVVFQCNVAYDLFFKMADGKQQHISQLN